MKPQSYSTCRYQIPWFTFTSQTLVSHQSYHISHSTYQTLIQTKSATKPIQSTKSTLPLGLIPLWIIHICWTVSLRKVVAYSNILLWVKKSPSSLFETSWKVWSKIHSLVGFKRLKQSGAIIKLGVQKDEGQGRVNNKLESLGGNESYLCSNA